MNVHEFYELINCTREIGSIHLGEITNCSKYIEKQTFHEGEKLIILFWTSNLEKLRLVSFLSFFNSRMDTLNAIKLHLC